MSKTTKRNTILCVMILILWCVSIILMGCVSNNKFDTQFPSLKEEDGWYVTLDDDFRAITSLEDTNWIPSPHGLRNYEYWCDQMVSLENGNVIINSEERTNHSCDVCKVEKGVFTSGIETRKDDKYNNEGFYQAFGYFEATVKVPTGAGMWSAFWLQCPGTTKIGNKGVDGTEIDVYESSFGQKNKTQTGSALHYDAYDSMWYRCIDSTTDVGYDLYDNEYHTYALKWTPNEYVFYVDGQVTWASDGGGVSRVPELLRLTVEIRDTYYGPYAQPLGKFSNADDDSNKFFIQSVKVYQNKNYEQYIMSPDDFKDMRKAMNAWATIGIILGVVGGVAIVGVGVMAIIKAKKKKA